MLIKIWPKKPKSNNKNEGYCIDDLPCPDSFCSIAASGVLCGMGGTGIGINYTQHVSEIIIVESLCCK